MSTLVKLDETCRCDTVLKDQATRRFVGGTIKDWSDHSCSSAVFRRCRGSTFNVFFFDIVVQFWQVLSNGQKHIKNR